MSPDNIKDLFEFLVLVSGDIAAWWLTYRLLRRGKSRPQTDWEVIGRNVDRITANVAVIALNLIVLVAIRLGPPQS